MVSRMHLAETDGAVWLFPASSGAATLVGVINLAAPPWSCTFLGALSDIRPGAGDLVTRV
jgi:hypothetical protein